MSSINDIKKKALVRLGVIGAEQPLPVALSNRIQSTYDSLYKFLAQKQAVTWGSSESIPNEHDDAIVSMFSYRLTNEFSVSDAKYLRLKEDNRQALRTLTASVYQGYIPNTAQVDY